MKYRVVKLCKEKFLPQFWQEINKGGRWMGVNPNSTVGVFSSEEQVKTCSVATEAGAGGRIEGHRSLRYWVQLAEEGNL